MSEENLAIWEQICETDKDFTKEATGKGYACTSINPNYIFHKITELFGPCGIGWGYDILDEYYRKGHKAIFHDKSSKQNIENNHVLHVCKIGLWYQPKDKNRSHSILAFGQTYFVRLTSGGWVTDEEAPKKSLTDALTKACSMLGMSADIFSGIWDGHKDHGSPETAIKTTSAPVAWGIKCPKCGKEDSIIKNKYNKGEFVCYQPKNDGCGFKFTPKQEEPKLVDDIPLDNSPVKFITDADRKKLFMKADTAKWPEEKLKLYLAGEFGIESTKEIPQNQFKKILSGVN